jgi:hypothetical protein
VGVSGGRVQVGGDLEYGRLSAGRVFLVSRETTRTASAPRSSKPANANTAAPGRRRAGRRPVRDADACYQSCVILPRAPDLDGAWGDESPMCEARIGRREGLVDLQRSVPCRGLISALVVWVRGLLGAFDSLVFRGRYMVWGGGDTSGGWTAS